MSDEVQLTGYEISREVAARMPFKAEIPGRLVVEVETSGVQLAEPTVR